MTQAIIYSRFSPCPGQDDSLSNEKQEGRCRAYCNQREYDIIRAFRDDAVSGTQLDRPGLSEAIADLLPGMILVVDRSDRLARDVIVDLTIRQRIKATGAVLEFADRTPNEDTPEGRLISGVFSLFAAFERDRIAARTSAGLRRKQANGEWLGKPPVGYRVVDRRLVEDAQEQLAIGYIRRISTFCKHSSAQIAELATEGYGLFRGKPWSARTIRKIIHDNEENMLDSEESSD